MMRPMHQAEFELKKALNATKMAASILATWRQGSPSHLEAEIDAACRQLRAICASIQAPRRPIGTGVPTHALDTHTHEIEL